MEEELKRWVTKIPLRYIDLPEESIENIYRLFVQDVVGKPQTGIEYFYYASYYLNVKKDYTRGKAYSLKSVELKCPHACDQLGYYYRFWECNYELAVKYFLIGVRLDSQASMAHLAAFYRRTQINYSLMKKYYHLAIARGNVNAIENLAFYYEEVEKNIVLMERYYLMAIEYGSVGVISILTRYYLEYEPKREYFEFALTHQQKSLLERNYRPEYVHDLLNVRNGKLPNTLLAEKQGYVKALFFSWRETPTYFSPSYCVRDIMEMIRAYI